MRRVSCRAFATSLTKIRDNVGPSLCKRQQACASGTFSNPESHSHFSLVNIVAESFNMVVAVKVVAPATLSSAEAPVSKHQWKKKEESGSAGERKWERGEGNMKSACAVNVPARKAASCTIERNKLIWDMIMTLQLEKCVKRRNVDTVRPSRCRLDALTTELWGTRGERGHITGSYDLR